MYCSKPFIGLEPMTYALPWRYSTTELKGLYYTKFNVYSRNKKQNKNTKRFCQHL